MSCALFISRPYIIPGQPPIPVEALVDSGASDSFLDPSILAGTIPLSLSTPSPDPNLFHQVPEAYHDFLDVFSELQANTLPPHRKYDLQINFLPGKTPPWGRIYTQSAVELVEMMGYLKAYLVRNVLSADREN